MSINTLLHTQICSCPRYGVTSVRPGNHLACSCCASLCVSCRFLWVCCAARVWVCVVRVQTTTNTDISLCVSPVCLCVCMRISRNRKEVRVSICVQWICGTTQLCPPPTTTTTTNTTRPPPNHPLASLNHAAYTHQASTKRIRQLQYPTVWRTIWWTNQNENDKFGYTNYIDIYNIYQQQLKKHVTPYSRHLLHGYC